MTFNALWSATRASLISCFNVSCDPSAAKRPVLAALHRDRRHLLHPCLRRDTREGWLAAHTMRGKEKL